MLVPLPRAFSRPLISWGGSECGRMQLQVPARQCSATDGLLDSGGSLFGGRPATKPSRQALLLYRNTAPLPPTPDPPPCAAPRPDGATPAAEGPVGVCTAHPLHFPHLRSHIKFNCSSGGRQ
jgi:hypothetical protein